MAFIYRYHHYVPPVKNSTSWLDENYKLAYDYSANSKLHDLVIKRREELFEALEWYYDEVRYFTLLHHTNA